VTVLDVFRRAIAEDLVQIASGTEATFSGTMKEDYAGRLGTCGCIASREKFPKAFDVEARSNRCLSLRMLRG
jgi:hypothetical protein